MKYYTTILLILASFLICNNAIAVCSYPSGSGYKSRTVTFPDVIVQRDTPAGATLATQQTATYTSATTFVSCGPGESLTMAYGISQFVNMSSIDKVYDTNIPGIGMRVKWTINNSLWPYNAYVAAVPNTGIGVAPQGTVTVELIKTVWDAVGAGYITPGEVASITATNLGKVSDIQLTMAKIVPVQCTITTPNLVFPLGDMSISDFGTTVGFTPGKTNTQLLGLNCDPNANVNVFLLGSQNPDVSNTSVLALSNQGNSDVAKGVGVQILYNGSPMTRSSNLVLKKSAGGQEMFPLTARYYQTKTSVTPGTASAIATLSVVYQ